MDLDQALERMETGETEAELIDQETELEDYESDDDQLFDENSAEEDYERAYGNFLDDNETDFGGWDDGISVRELRREEEGDILNGEGYHLIDEDDLKEEAVEMEIDEGNIEAYIVDENDNEIGFIVIEDGKEVEYYYADDDSHVADSGAVAQAVSDENMRKELADERAVREEEAYDLGITREGVDNATNDLNAIYKEGLSVASELKGAYDDIVSSFDFLKKK